MKMSKEKAAAFARALERAVADKKKQKQGYSARKMAEAAGIPYYTIANLKRGSTDVSRDIILKISAELPTFEQRYKEELEHLAEPPPEAGRDSDPQKAIEQILKEIREIKNDLVRENQELMRKYVKELEKNIELLKRL